MYSGEIPTFDPQAGIEENASVLYSELGLMPAVFLKKYRTFKTDFNSWGGTSVTERNVDLVLLLHFLQIVRKRHGVGPETQKQLIRDYCGHTVCDPQGEHPLVNDVGRLLKRKEVKFKLTEAGKHEF